MGKSEKEIILFCFPHAGGSAIIYNNWKGNIDETIRLRPIELSGRGMRFKEPFYKNMDEAISDTYDIVTREISRLPYMLLGHSMGGLIALELYYKLTQNGHPPPARLFISGVKAPHIPIQLRKVGNLSDAQFKEEMSKFEGTPPEIFSSERLAKLFLPIMKADMLLREGYIYQKHKHPLTCNLDIFYGDNDSLTPSADMAVWREYTTRKCSLHEFKGGHFFLYQHEHMTRISSIINSTAGNG